MRGKSFLKILYVKNIAYTLETIFVLLVSNLANGNYIVKNSFHYFLKLFWELLRNEDYAGIFFPVYMITLPSPWWKGPSSRYTNSLLK